MNGFEAWSRIYRRYNPVTPSRALQAMIAVMVPMKVKDSKDLPNEIEKWEGRLLNLQREYKETLSERMKVAAITSMCPPDIQDVIFQRGDNLDEYLKVRDQIKTLVVNRGSRIGGPVPMDIGAATQEQQEQWEEQEYNVDAVGVSTQCYKCGRFWTLGP